MYEEEGFIRYRTELERMNRLYNALSQINQSIVHVRERQLLFERVCEIAVELGGFRLAFIGWIEPQTMQVIPVASYGPHTDYLETATIYADQRPEGTGPTGQSIRSGKSYVCNDFFNDITTTRWREAAAAHGFRSSANFPIFLDGKVCGVFVLYAGEPGFFRDREIQLLEEAAGDLSFALDTFQHEEKRRKAEAAAQQLATIVQSTSDAIISTGVDGTILTWNAGAEQILGYRAEELLGQSFIQLVPPEKQEQVRSEMTKVLAGRSVSFEGSLTHRNGTLLPVSSTVSPVFDGANQITGICSIIRDVSERNAVLSALRESNGLLQIMINEAPTGLAMLDREMRVLAASNRWKEDRGLAGVDVIGRNHFELEPGIPADWRQQHLRVLEGETIVSLRDCYTRCDGQQRWLSRTLRPWLTGSGEIGGTVILAEDITERKLAEEALADESARTRLLFEHAADPMFLLDGEDAIVEANESFARLLGLPLERLHGMHPWDWDADYTTREALQAHFPPRDSSPQILEARIRSTSGEIRNAELNITSTEWRGRLLYFHVLRDVTDRKRAEAALHEAEEHLRLVINSLDEGLFIAAESGKLLTWNPAARRIYGIPEEDRALAALADFPSILTLYAPDGSELALSEWPMARILRGEDIRELEIRSISRFINQERILCYSGSLVHVGAHRKLAFLRCQDVTAKRQAEESLHESRARFETLVDSLNEGLMICELDGRLIRWNPVVARILGFTLEEAPGFTANDFLEHIEIFDIEGGAIPPGQSPVQLILQGKELRDALYRIHHFASDRNYIFSYSGAIVGYEGGKRMAFVKFQDVTERFLAEEKLEQTRAQLMQSQKMEAIGLLAGGVAHDFNNALGVILGYGEMLEERLATDETSSKYIHQILQAQQRATALTRQLLAFSRKQRHVREPINLSLIAKGLEEMLDRLLGADIKLRLDCEPDLHSILADASQMEQVLMNLAVNARDAMACGGSLSICTRNLPDAVQLIVSDTGSGMDKATQERIFEPFFTTKEPGRGTGLGLSILYAIVEQNEGQIALESQPGCGTTFTLSFPAINSQPCPVTPSVQKTEATLGTETLLLVDDEASLRILLGGALRARGYRVLEAANGTDALAQIRQIDATIDLLISDIIMPAMSGPELMKQLQAGYPAIKSIFISGYTDDYLSRYGDFGTSITLLQKPFSPEILLATVRRILDEAAS